MLYFLFMRLLLSQGQLPVFTPALDADNILHSGSGGDDDDDGGSFPPVRVVAEFTVDIYFSSSNFVTPTILLVRALCKIQFRLRRRSTRLFNPSPRLMSFWPLLLYCITRVCCSTRRSRQGRLSLVEVRYKKWEKQINLINAIFTFWHRWINDAKVTDVSHKKVRHHRTVVADCCLQLSQQNALACAPIVVVCFNRLWDKRTI